MKTDALAWPDTSIELYQPNGAACSGAVCCAYCEGQFWIGQTLVAVADAGLVHGDCFADWARALRLTRGARVEWQRARMGKGNRVHVIGSARLSESAACGATPRGKTRWHAPRPADEPCEKCRRLTGAVR